MPEGDTIFRAAQTLHRVFSGKVVSRFESVFPALNRVAEDSPIVGRTIESVVSRGKHLLMTFSGGQILRTHMRMNGSWHVYPTGARWRRPARDMRILVATEDAVAIGFNVPVAEFISADSLRRHETLQALGPDLLDPSFDRAEAARRIRAHASESIGDVLLNQRVVAGIGNVFKAEILFLAGIDPFTPTASLSDAQIDGVLDVALAQLCANVLTSRQTLSPAIGRRTTRSLDPRETLWVYGRGGKPCRRCGAIVQAMKTGPEGRLTYWCGRCQPPSRKP